MKNATPLSGLRHRIGRCVVLGLVFLPLCSCAEDKSAHPKNVIYQPATKIEPQSDRLNNPKWHRNDRPGEAHLSNGPMTPPPVNAYGSR